MPRKGKGNKRTRKSGAGGRSHSRSSSRSSSRSHSRGRNATTTTTTTHAAPMSWGNIANAEERAGRWRPARLMIAAAHHAAAAAPHHRSRSRSRSRTPRSPGGTAYGEIRDFNAMTDRGQIYTEDGWKTVYDPYGDYGGPFNTYKELAATNRYQSNERELMKYKLESYNENSFTGKEKGGKDVWDPHGKFGGPFYNSRGLTQNEKYLTYLKNKYGVATDKEALEADRKARRAKKVAAKGTGGAGSSRRNGRRSTRRS